MTTWQLKSSTPTQLTFSIKHSWNVQMFLSNIKGIIQVFQWSLLLIQNIWMCSLLTQYTCFFLCTYFYPGSEAWVKFLAFFFFRHSVTNRPLVSRAHASLVHAHGTRNFQKLSLKKASSDSMIFRAMKSHTNEHTVHHRLTLKVVKRFRNRSVCKAYEINLRANILVNLSRIMLVPKELSTGAITSSTR